MLFLGFVWAQLILSPWGEVRHSLPEIGWFDVELTSEGEKDPLFEFFKSTQKIFQWHGDMFSIPKGAVHLASSKHCKNQAFRYGKNVYGFQFHMEVNHGLIERWLDEKVNASELEKHKENMNIPLIREESLKYLNPLQNLSDKTFSLFLTLMGIQEKDVKLSSR